MPIQINPNRINIDAGLRSRPQRGASSELPLPPKRAHVNVIPAPESLATLIRGAVEALRGGVFWERGSILNLLV